MEFRCPKCQRPLVKIDNSLVCENHHSYDYAAAGYVNLLLVNQKRSKDPGDSKESINSRHRFLNEGYYQCLADTLKQITANLLTANDKLLDAGCGTGYYLHQIMQNNQVEYYAIDIGKDAMKVCAKSNPQAYNAVAGVFHLPINDHSMKVVMSCFCPYSKEEFSRVCVKNGYVVAVIPGARHLYQMKEIVYDNPYENTEEGYDLPDFELVERRKVTDQVTLRSVDDIKALWMMTPYYHKTKLADSEKLFSYQSLETTVEFVVLVYRKVD